MSGSKELSASSGSSDKEENIIYRVRKVRINSRHELYSYCDNLTRLGNNLSNAVRFRQRQLLTSFGKDPADIKPLEQAVLDEIDRTLPLLGEKFSKPKGKTAGYAFWNAILLHSMNPDYYAAGLPRQSAQWVIKRCVQDFKDYFEALKKYKKDPSSFTGRPELPGYKKKGGRCMVAITNEDAVIREEEGRTVCKLPLTSKRLLFGEPISGMRFKEVKITPDNGEFVIGLVFAMEEKPFQLPDPERIAAVDPGLDNLMAVTNNCGLPSLLYKGGAAKSVNHLYNKKIAGIVSSQTKGTTNKFVPTEEYYRVTIRRNNQLDDLIHKISLHFIRWCVENRIDTIVFGVNRLWKQDIDLGNQTNQNFVQIPYLKLRSTIHYLADRNHIRYIEQEESYTSKASFPDGDEIPVYKDDDSDAIFSGKRITRGMYRTKQGLLINADLNGSANIMRKHFPGAFCSCMPDFEHVEVIKHPCLTARSANREKQLQQPKQISRSKQKRLARKAA